MKHLKKFENFVDYTSTTPVSFDSMFGIDKRMLTQYLSYLIDKYDYLEFDIYSESKDTFDLEIFGANPSVKLVKEFDWYKKNLSEHLKKQFFEAYNIDITSEKFDDKRNRIIISCKKNR
jgi:hypothetical protein